MDIIQDVLIYQTHMLRNSSLGPYVPADFSPPQHIVVVNALFYSSLGIMILAAFVAMLIKSWVREFDRGLRAMSLPEQRAKTREFRYLGMERWKLPEMVAILPLLIQISLLLFAVGLVLFLFHISRPSFGVTMAIFGVGIFFYAITTSISVFITSSPFHSPLSRTLCEVYRQVHNHFCPRFGVFLSATMDTIPATALGRVRRDLQIFLQKSRPYLETDFVEPFAATPLDEVQHFTAASALQRIHDSAPNSQHSETLQWSVWQVAGSATHRVTPLFDVPSWILYREDNVNYFSRLPQAMVVALVAVSLRAPRWWDLMRMSRAQAALQRMDSPKPPLAQLVTVVLGRTLRRWFPHYINRGFVQTQFGDLIDIIQRKELHKAECLWLLSTLSELCSKGLLEEEEPMLIRLCLTLLLDDALYDPIILEAVVTLAAISCSPEEANRLNILNTSREHPWLLPNLRNPALFSKWLEDNPSNSHKQLISLLFLILFALIERGSYPLAVQYFTVITANGDLSIYTSALTAIAPSMYDRAVCTIGMMLVTPQTRGLTSVIEGLMVNFADHVDSFAQEDLFKTYDHQLGASGNPDPNLFAILLMVSKRLFLYKIQALQSQILEFKNPWLRLAARVVARLDIPDGSGLPLGLSYDHPVNNMIAAFSLLRYTEGNVTQYTESLLLASFLESRELSISSVALEYYMKTIISYSGPSAPSCYLSRAVHAVFNLMLPDHQLQVGWEILEIFVTGFENLPVEWRRTFAEGFFTLSRQPQPRSRGDTGTNTPETRLWNILTWGYFHEKEQEANFTDLDFSGVDWMAMAWSLHLSQQSKAKSGGPLQEVESHGLSARAVTEEFVLQALCKLLEAAPYYQTIPVTHKVYEFVHWFDDTDVPEYRGRIFAQMEKVHRYKFRKFHCMWYV